VKAIMRILNFLYIVFIFFLTQTFSQKSNPKITPEGIFADKVETQNPELDFLSFYETQSEFENLDENIVYKVNYDFNSDGIQDIALTDRRIWGAHIGPWAIYLGLKNKNYLFFDELWFYDPIRIDSIKNGTSRILVYENTGGGNAEIIEYLFASNGIKEISREHLVVKNSIGEETADFKKVKSIFSGSVYIIQKMKVTDYLKNKIINWVIF
jgi:hypothetical protein